LGVLLFTPLALMSIQQNASASDVNFVCGRDPRSGIPATIAQFPDNESVVMITWEIRGIRNWAPQQRCEEVARRFNRTNQRGILKYMVEGKMNGLPVVCASPNEPQDVAINCDENNLLVTIVGGGSPQTFISNVNNGLGNEVEGVRGTTWGQQNRGSTALQLSREGLKNGLNVGILLDELLAIPKCSSAPLFTPCR